MRNIKKIKTLTDKYEAHKVKRRGSKSFKHLKPKKVGKVYELEYNGRLYRNTKSKLLLEDIGVIENG